MSSAQYLGHGKPKNPLDLSTLDSVTLAIAYVLQDLDPDEVAKKAEEASDAFSYWAEQRGIQMREEGDDDQTVKSHIEKVFLVSNELSDLELACSAWPVHYVRGVEAKEERLKRAKDGIALFKTKVDEILGLGADGVSIKTGSSATSESQVPSRNDTGSTVATVERIS
jgi:hypothetical protein